MTVGIYMKVELPDVKYTPKEFSEYLKYRSGQSNKIGSTNPLVNDNIVEVEYSIGKAYQRKDLRVYKTDIDKVMKAIVYVTGVPASIILSGSRHRENVLARHLLFYTMYRYSWLTLKAIGRLTKRDHSSVLHGNASIKDRIETGDEIVIEAIAKIKNVLGIEDLNPTHVPETEINQEGGEDGIKPDSQA